MLGKISSGMCSYFSLFVIVSIGRAGIAADAGTPCMDTLEIVGDEQLVDKIDAWRDGNPLIFPGADSCSSLRVRVKYSETGEISLELFEKTTLKYQRTVTQMDTALMLLESWFDQEMVDRLLPSEPVRDAEPPAPVSESKPTSKQADRKRKKKPQQPDDDAQKTHRHIHIGFLADAALWVAGDESSWVGVDIGAYHQIKSLRFGARGRYGSELSARSATAHSGRDAVAALMTVGYPMIWHYFVFVPGIAVGGMVVIGPGLSDDDGGEIGRGRYKSMQLEADLWAGVYLSKHLGFGFGTQFTVSLLGNTDDVEIAGQAVKTQPVWFLRLSLGVIIEW